MPDLIIQTESSGVSSDDTGKAEQCLLKDDDVWSVVFGDVFHSFAGEGESVRAESSYEDCNEASQAFFEFLLFVASLPERRIAEIPAGIKSKECVIARQLLSWYDSYADQLKIEKFQHDIQGRAQSFVDRYKCFRPCVGLVDGQRTLLTRFDDQNVRERIGRFVEALRKWVGNDCSEASWPQCDDCEYDGLRLFVDELKVSFLQTHVMVRKYEERIVTLPKSFSAKSVTVDKQNANSTSGVPYDQVGVSVHLLPKGALNEKHSTQKSVNYLRHYDASDFAANFAHMMYAEPLSGTQGYLNMIVGLKALPDAGGFVANLMESALARILIVDERVADFLRAHPAQMKVFSMMGIWSVDDKAYGDENRSCNETTIDEHLPLLNGHILLNLYMLAGIRRAMIKNDSNDSKSLERWKTRIRTRLSRHFDILIIHQGLIDKWLQGASSNRNVVSMLIEYLKQIVPYVIITTGRGTPANIPATARILPFSVVESTLFRNNPEKMVLIDTIMSILPTGERK